MRGLLATAALAAALGHLALGRAGGGLPPAPVPVAPAQPTAFVPALPGALPGPWPEQLARPPFDPSRRPPAPVEVSVPAFEPPPPGAAAGIVIGPSGPLALLRLVDGRVQRVAEGMEVEGWRVTRIESARVELERDGRRVELRARPQQAGPD
ncbi:hypothetical protein [Falsiroseomonas sp. CW058]|uniref:hypothetical protein n=1 Tax=Falsiroseomonas sp. CW058 TaxID=3388664 RepID=UPI003D313AAA